LAAKNGHYPTARFLVDTGVNVHGERELALRNAARRGDLQTAMLMLERGANIEADDNDALFGAVCQNHLAMATFLLRNGARAGENLLWIAIFNLNFRMMRIVQRAINYTLHIEEGELVIIKLTYLLFFGILLWRLLFAAFPSPNLCAVTILAS
jgi:ankyrin repeat protein